MAEKQRDGFKSATTDYAAIKKRMEELGIAREQPGAKNGVEVVPVPPMPDKLEPGHYY